MQTISTILNIKQNKLFVYGLLVFLCIATIYLLICGKSAAFISLNAYHPFWLNVFFINYTFIGDGIFAICLVAVLYFYFKKRKIAITFLYSFFLSGLVVQIIKNLVHAPRPKLFFESGQYLFFLDGVTRTGNSSFPSGHTTTAFAIATVAVLLMKNKKWQLFILVGSVLVGYSRIYLAQHFLLDIIIGSIIGFVTGVLSVYLVKNSKGLTHRFKKIHRISSNIPEPPPAVQPI